MDLNKPRHPPTTRRSRYIRRRHVLRVVGPRQIKQGACFKRFSNKSLC